MRIAKKTLETCIINSFQRNLLGRGPRVGLGLRPSKRKSSVLLFFASVNTLASSDFPLILPTKTHLNVGENHLGEIKCRASTEIR